MKQIINNNYTLIGIGEFSHGIQESWEYRYKFLKFCLKNTNKNITIFNEMEQWNADNIMNYTIYDYTQKKYLNQKFKLEQFIDNTHNNKPSFGILQQYCNHTTESKIFLKILLKIRKYNNRISIIGIDNGKIDRDYYMYKKIMGSINENNINFLWAHNCHISTSEYQPYNMKYIKNKNHKYYCGYYLKNKLKDKYCIILSTAYEGINRFNSYCSDQLCSKRMFKLNYFYKKFKNNYVKKYIKNNKKYNLLKTYNQPFINFSNSYFMNNKYGYASYETTNIFNYVLFFKFVNYLKPLFDYQ